MEEKIKWENIGQLQKTAVVELCGWCNKKGNATPTGKRIANINYWHLLSPAAKNVLTRHGVTQ